MDFKDYYAALGVEKTADADTVKKAYRRLARKYHPDLSKEADAASRMSDINEAYAVLSDAEKRAAYDSVGQGRKAGQDFEPPPDWGSGFEFSGAGAGGGSASDQDFSDFFSSLFGRERAARGGFDPRGAARAERGEDHHARISIDLPDAYLGAKRSISLRAARLDDSGRVVNDERTIEVQIPKGVKEGQLIRLTGQGTPGYAGGPAGDLYLEVHFATDARWRVVERDVHQRLPVAPWEAALGAAIEVPTPDGSRVQVRVPAASQTGRKLRLKGRGIPAATPGDLYLELEVVLPPANDDAARKLYETMAREMKFDPRAAMGA